MICDGLQISELVPIGADICEEETETVAIPTRLDNFGRVADSSLARCGGIRLATRFSLAHHRISYRLH